MVLENDFHEDSGGYEIEGRLQNSTLHFNIRDKADGAQVLTGGVTLDQSPRGEEILLLVKRYLRKFAELNP
jgi:hypothetical protein